MSQQRESDCLFTWKTCVWYLCSGLCSVRFTVLWCTCRRNRTRSRRGGHRRLCCVSNQESGRVRHSCRRSHEDRFWIHECYEGATIETTEVGFTFAGGETEAASTKNCIPHAEFPQRISANESTPFLIDLDVLRKYGLVIDYHFNRVCSDILKSYLPCAILPTGRLALEMLPSNSEWVQHPVANQAS